MTYIGNAQYYRPNEQLKGSGYDNSVLNRRNQKHGFNIPPFGGKGYPVYETD